MLITYASQQQGGDGPGPPPVPPEGMALVIDDNGDYVIFNGDYVYAPAYDLPVGMGFVVDEDGNYVRFGADLVYAWVGPDPADLPEGMAWVVDDAGEYVTAGDDFVYAEGDMGSISLTDALAELTGDVVIAPSCDTLALGSGGLTSFPGALEVTSLQSAGDNITLNCIGLNINDGSFGPTLIDLTGGLTMSGSIIAPGLPAVDPENEGEFFLTAGAVFASAG